MLTVGSLFSGIGGLDLGLERAGMRVVWQSEIDPYASRILKKHWPDVPNLGDITTIKEFPYVDVICGGFPCVDISNAGRRAGIEGKRSGLWSEMLRCVRLVRPRYVIVENVAALLGRGMGRVIGDLAESGYDAEWDCLSACEFGASHTRERVFVVAYPAGERQQEPRLDWSRERNGTANGDWQTGGLVDAVRRRTLPYLCRDHQRLSRGMDRMRCLGNAVVPQVAEWIGKRIMEAEQRRHNETQ